MLSDVFALTKDLWATEQKRSTPFPYLAD